MSYNLFWRRFVVNILVFGFISMLAVPITAQTKRVEVESSQVSRHVTLKVMDDNDASGGQMVEVPGTVDGENIVTLKLPEDVSPGYYRLLLRARIEDYQDLGQAWRIDVQDGKHCLGHGVLYGLWWKGKVGYQQFPVDFELDGKGPLPAVTMRWTGQNSAMTSTGHPVSIGGNPKIFLDAIDFVRLGDLPGLKIVRVWPDRVRYMEDQDGEVTVTLENITAQPQSGEVKVEITHDLKDPESLGIRPINLEPGAQMEINFPLNHGGGTFGYDVKAVIFQEGKQVDEKVEYFCVHNNSYAVSTSMGDNWEPEPPWGSAMAGWWPPYGIGSTLAELKGYARQKRLEYVTNTERGGRYHTDNLCMAPKEPLWVYGQGGDHMVSKWEQQTLAEAMANYGIGYVAYHNNIAMGPESVTTLQRHPEWFVYSKSTGDLQQNYDMGAYLKFKQFWEDFDWEKYRSVSPEGPNFKGTPEDWVRWQQYGQAINAEVGSKLGGPHTTANLVLNYKLPAVIDYVANEIIAAGKMLGITGVRWDCGNLETGLLWGSYEPYIDFYGKPLAATPEEMELQTASNIRLLMAKVRRVFPNFAFGTNYGSPDETKHYPEITKALCEGGAFMLNEWSMWYDSPQSPYCYWDKHYRTMCEQGEYVTNLGGHYGPMSGSYKYPVDRLYGTIFRLVGKGHPHVPYYNTRAPIGHIPQFCVRFGRFIFDPKMRRVMNPGTQVRVKASGLIWWDQSVQRLQNSEGDFLIVHLINPPAGEKIGDTPNAREPVNQVEVSTNLPSGKTKVRAWVITAESWTIDESPRTKAVPLKVSFSSEDATVSIPQVIFWKTVVFKFK